MTVLVQMRMEAQFGAVQTFRQPPCARRAACVRTVGDISLVASPLTMRLTQKRDLCNHKYEDMAMSRGL
jgi:hypothetical protein